MNLDCFLRISAFLKSVLLNNVVAYLGDDEKQKQLASEFSLLCNWMKKKIGDRISKVQVSKRLSSSPCVLVSGKDGWSANMERYIIVGVLDCMCDYAFGISAILNLLYCCRVMRAQNLGDTPGLREFMWSTRVLEINPNHPVILDLDVSIE